MLNRILRVTLLVCILSSALLLGIAFYVVHYPIMDISVVIHEQAVSGSILLDDEGSEWGRFELDKHQPITLDRVPKHVVQAFLAAEDHAFFDHQGLSWRGIIRSLLVNTYHGKKLQGASTITQQLVRLLYFDSRKSFKRKIKEQIIALLIEQQCTKEQILEKYLNAIYLGCGIYGIETASRRFWNKSIPDLSIDEAATLAAIVQSPTRLCPLNNPQLTERRRNTILERMSKRGYISADAYNQAREKNITIDKENGNCAPHAKETIRQLLEEALGKEALYTGGLIIQTTLNRHMQDAASTVFTHYLTKFKKQLSPQIDGALLSIEGATGEIKALIGGYDFKESQFNRATQAYRQMGSIFKPLIYAHALLKGRSLKEIAIDEPFEITEYGSRWTPQNFYHDYYGSMTLAHSLALSNNIIPIKLLLAEGPSEVVALARRCGIKQLHQPHPSLALGCVDTTLEQNVALINIFAQHGTYHQPHLVRWVKNPMGTKIWKYQHKKYQALSPRIADQIVRVLRHNIDVHKKRAPQLWVDSQAFGKTGTTNDARSCWYVGATPTITTGVYLGRDDNKALGKTVAASQTVFPLWRDVNKLIGSSVTTFSYSTGLKERTIDPKTGTELDLYAAQGITILE